MKRIIFALIALCSFLGSESAQAQRAITVWRDGQPSVIFGVDSVLFWKVPAEPIDLGLPSGLKWASCNLGASRPEDFGSYFAWGETEEKDLYNWSTYMHCDGSETTCHDLGNSISGTQYDVAYVTWDEKWRMPTKDEFQELLDNCTYEWTQQNGIDGAKFTSSNGNSIFLPAAGSRNEDNLYNEGSYGLYWSGTLNPSNSHHACRLYFYGSNAGWDESFRDYGFSVRPVLVEYDMLALSTDTISLEVGSSATVQITAGSGYYSCASNDTSVVSISLEGSTLTLTTWKVGETQIVVTDNKTQQTATIAVTVTELKGYFVVAVNGVIFRMVRVSGGTFQMGATTEQESEAETNEKPIHNITLSDYAIGETEVTQELWYAVMGQKPMSDGNQWISLRGLGDKYPVYYVTWEDCQTFISKLNELTGMTFRLPTEAEWEFAARGGNSSQGYKYAGSNSIGDVAWYTENSDYTTHPVATKSPNELGLYDMSGNVWEWCQDWYNGSYYSFTSQVNPSGPTSGSSRVLRGGSWGSYASSCRVSIRDYGSPYSSNYYRGLRLAQ